MANELIGITGSTGFIGSALAAEYRKRSFPVKKIGRYSNESIDDAIYGIGDISKCPDWIGALKNVTTLVHCAGYAHAGIDRRQSRKMQNSINYKATKEMAIQAISLGVRRIVYISSIKAATYCNKYSNNQDKTKNNISRLNSLFFKYIDMWKDPYGFSKYRAEKTLVDLANKHNFELVIIRPPLVYGPGVGGNFHRLVSAASRWNIFPFGMIKNKRSYIAIQNLVDFIILCSIEKNAKGKVFEVSDMHDLSTPALMEILVKKLHKLGLRNNSRIVFLPIPVSILKAISFLMGNLSSISKLTDSLCIDSTMVAKYSCWKPIIGVHDALEITLKNMNLKKSRSL